MDNILHKDTGIGAVLGDSSSSRSGSSTSNTKTYTLSDGTVLTLADAVYKYRNKVFDDAYGLAYSSNIAAPSRDEMMKGNINSELNALRKRYTDKTGNTFVQLSDGSLLTMPVSVYNERNAIYTQAYGLAYSNNVAAPDFDECFKGNGAAELQKVQGRIVAKQAAAQVDQDSNPPRTSATAAAAVSPSTSDGANNGLLWLLLGAAAIGLVVMSSKSKTKKRKR